MSTFLADANVLIALTVVEHVHHRVCMSWFDGSTPDLATCPITEGALLRFLLREGRSASEAVGVLDAIRTQEWHRFWPATLPFQKAHLSGVIGHRQVTDAYLVALARQNKGQLVTLDRGLASLHPKHVHLLTAG